MDTVTVKWELEHDVRLGPSGPLIKQGDTFEMPADEAQSRAASGQISIVKPAKAGKAEQSIDS